MSQVQSFNTEARLSEARGLMTQGVSDTDQSVHDVSLQIGSSYGGQTLDIQTKYGPVCVVCMGTSQTTALVTFPEIGVDFRDCFQPLFSASAGRSLLYDNFRQIHIFPPEAASLSPDFISAPTLDKYSDIVLQVLSTLQIKEVIGIGVGVGAHVICKAALDSPKTFIGLIMVSPAVSVASVWERAVGYSMGQLLSSGLPDHLLTRLLANRTLITDLGKQLRTQLQKRRLDGAKIYLTAALARPSIVPQLKQLKCRTLLLGGQHSLYRDDMWQATSHLPKDQFAYISVENTGLLVTAEAPQQLLRPIEDYLRALQLEGYGQEWDLY